MIVPSFPDDVVVAIRYDQTGLATADLADYQAVGWRIDDYAAGWGFNPLTNRWVYVICPPGRTQPQPQLIGDAPFPTPNTGQVVSPPWARVQSGLCSAPEFRGSLADFFTFVATNNGAHRLLSGNFLHSNIDNTWKQWSQQNGDLVQPSGATSQRSRLPTRPRGS